MAFGRQYSRLTLATAGFLVLIRTLFLRFILAFRQLLHIVIFCKRLFFD